MMRHIIPVRLLNNECNILDRSTLSTCMISSNGDHGSNVSDNVAQLQSTLLNQADNNNVLNMSIHQNSTDLLELNDGNQVLDMSLDKMYTPDVEVQVNTALLSPLFRSNTDAELSTATDIESFAILNYIVNVKG